MLYNRVSGWILASVICLVACTPATQTRGPVTTTASVETTSPTVMAEPTATVLRTVPPDAAPTTAVPHAQMTEEKLAELEAYISEAMPLEEIPGLSIAIVHDGEVIYTKGFGVRELGKSDPVGPETLMMLASSSKPLTTLMMASLVDDGLMTWDTPAVSIMPSYAIDDPERTKNLTITQMTCACSGIPEPQTSLLTPGQESPEAVFSRLRRTAPVAEPGKEYHYNNDMLAAAGYLAGLAAGGTEDDLLAGYASAMQERIFDPIGMADTTVSTEQVQASGNYAMPHSKTLARHYVAMPLSAENVVVSIVPAGGIWSTAEDMSRLMLTLLNKGIMPGGERVISEEGLAKLWEPQVQTDDSPSIQYASGWMIEDYRGISLVHHPGNSLGFSTEFVLAPDSEFGTVILTNAESAGKFTKAIRNRLLELAYDLPSESGAIYKRSVDATHQRYSSYTARMKQDLDEKLVAPYLGTLENPEVGEFTLKVEDSKLMIYGAMLTSELQQLSGETTPTFVLTDPPWAAMGIMTFVFKQDGNGNPIIVVNEAGIKEPMVFEKKEQ